MGKVSLRGLQNVIFWHGEAVRSFLFFLAAFAFTGLLPCPGADSHLALLRTLNSDSSEAKRLEALSQLEKSAPLEAGQILRSLTDTSPAIRAAMVRLGTPLAASDAELALRLLALSYDRAPQVQRQMLLALPTLNHPEAKTAYRKLLETARRSANAELRSFAQSLPQLPQ